MTVSPFAKYDAVTQEQIAAQWRDWCRYLRAHLTLLDVRAAENRVAFERAETLEGEAAQAQADLHAIPVARRTIFDMAREERRQQVQEKKEAAQRTPTNSARIRPIDPDVVDRQALTELLAEAEGRATPTDIPSLPAGWGTVPIEATAGSDKWWGVDVAALMDAPQAAAYEVGRLEADDRKRRLLLLAGLLIGATLLLTAWYLWPKEPLYLAPVSAVPATINDAAAPVWPIQTLIVTHTHGERLTTLPISTTQALSWPALTAEAPPTAFWRESVLRPVMVCMPASALQNLTQIELVGGGDVPVRTYALREDMGSAPIDLIVETCTQEQVARPRCYGTLQATLLPPSLHPGAAARIGDAITVTLQALVLVGPGEDVLLPRGQAYLHVRVTASSALDWPTLAPTLLLSSGQALLPSQTTATPDGADLAYLIPLPAEPLEVAWSLTPASHAAIVRWRATLDVPPDRTTVLGQSLAIAEATAATGRHPGTVQITLTLRNQGRTPLQLTPADLALTQGEQKLTVPDLAALRAPLAPGESRTISLDIPLANRQPLVLAAGIERMQLTL
jgi:hypothetical protein